MTATSLSFSKNTVFVDAPPTGALGGRLVKFAPLIEGNAPISCEAVKLVKLSPEPEKEVAVNAPDDELNVRLDPVFGATFPVAAVENKTLQEVSDDSSETVTFVAVEAVPVIAPAALIAPAKYDVPPVTLRPAVTVTIPDTTGPVSVKLTVPKPTRLLILLTRISDDIYIFLVIYMLLIILNKFILPAIITLPSHLFSGT